MTETNRPTIREVLGPGGIVREHREPQIAMAEKVAAAIAERKNLVVEAGTGTGKTLAYLAPLAAAGKRGVVSTGTKALQDQLEQKDLPWLRQQMKDRYGITVQFAVLKGASNYKCNRRFHEALTGHAPGATMTPAIEQWGFHTETGDMATAPSEMDAATARAIAVDLDDCDKEKCPYFEDCHFRQARQNAAKAQILVVNHALLMASLVNPFLLGELGQFHAAILDEAHQVEEVAREAFGGRLSGGAIKQLIQAVEKHLIGVDAVAGQMALPGVDAAAPADVEAWVKYRDAFRAKALAMLMPWMNPEDTTKDALISIDYIRQAGQEAAEALAVLSLFVKGKIEPENPDHKRIDRQLDRLREFFGVIRSGDAIAVARREVVEGEPYARVTLESYPLNVGARLEEHLYKVLPTIYTSATLSAGGNFHLAKEALGLGADVEALELPSPFDYPNQALLYVPRDVPDPKHPAYMRKLVAEIRALVNASGGGAFVLFTSYRAMQEAHGMLRDLRYPTQIQGAQPKGQLIEWFQGGENNVLFATASFWEGVSIEGRTLRLVIMDKIPFPALDPIHQAKGAILTARGGNEFNALSVPQAILRLKQGFGRLIRTRQDRGVVAILDSRLHGKGYGKRMIAALPPAHMITSLEHSLGQLEAFLGDTPPGAAAPDATAFCPF